ncbi:MAG: tRNA (adenosine(37)-N6)-threonylcarbamoyltransferase complex transferase subunit TsaD [Candidatus Moraniibacteriota bacterium]
MPALIVGVNAAKTLALIWDKPLLGIQHLEGHIYANLLGEHPSLAFPLLALVVSGGHTQLVLMKKDFSYQILGETVDDAAGEAFDKVARILGLPYPGGPEVAKRADSFRTSQPEERLLPLRRLFPRPLLQSPDYQFSFSGLKTAVLYEVRKQPEAERDDQYIASICYAFQEAAVDVLVQKTARALEAHNPKSFVIAGGVSANVELRKRLQHLLQNFFPQTLFRTPPFAYSLDNAAMIGAAALERFAKMSEEEKTALKNQSVTLAADANLALATDL